MSNHYWLRDALYARSLGITTGHCPKMPGQEAGIQASFLFRGQLTFLGDSLLFSEIRGHEIGDQDLTQNAPNARNWRL